MYIKGKNIVITGCMQGIGNRTMEICAAQGANMFACAYKETEEFKNQVETLVENYGVEITPIYFDMLDNDSIKNAAKEIQKSKTRIDGLINIAGMNQDAVFHMVTKKQLEDTFQVNFFSQIYFTQYITKLMIRNKEGSVVFTSSISAIDGNEGQLAYGASKAALIAATKTMSKELGPKGIRVNAIAPGVIKTAMTDALEETVISRMIRKADFGRVGRAEEVANVLMFLVSDKSAHITGQVIRVDGGIG